MLSAPATDRKGVSKWPGMARAGLSKIARTLPERRASPDTRKRSDWPESWSARIASTPLDVCTSAPLIVVVPSAEKALRTIPALVSTPAGPPRSSEEPAQ